ncbi:hypothetical protein WA158_000966 [Blastocystis sp. Blastoise]
MKSVIILCIIACIASSAAVQKPVSLPDLVGSWIYNQKKITLSTGAILEAQSLAEYNITSTGSEGEYELIPVFIHNGFRMDDEKQYVMSTKDNMTATLNEIINGETPETKEIVTFTLQEFLKGDFYMAFGSIPNSNYQYEFTYLNKNYISVKFSDVTNDVAYVISARRVIVPPPKTFFQKYGTYIMMAAIILSQLLTKGLVPNEQPQEHLKTN